MRPSSPRESNVPLHPCHECSAQISTLAPACPNCGAPIQIAVTKRKKSGLLWWMTCAAIAGFVIFVKLTPEPERTPLDFSKPIYTGEDTEICSISRLYDRRSGHDMIAVEDAFMSIFSRSSKFKELGCEEWHSGVRVHAKKMDGQFGFVAVGLSPENLSLFTIEADLHN